MRRYGSPDSPKTIEVVMSDALTPLRIIVFRGVQNLPSFAAEANGFYKKRGIVVETVFTGNSEQQRGGLASGEYDLAHGAVDNAVAMVDVAKEDIAIFMGLDQGFNMLVVQPEIKSYEDLRGKTIGVDAPDTAFALVAYEMLRLKGLNAGDYKILPVGATQSRLDAMRDGKIDFAMLNLPFNIFAQRAGLTVLADPKQAITAYQSTGGFVLRGWAKKNHDVFVRYIAAYIEGLRWALDPANRAAAIQILIDRMNLPHDIVEESVKQILDPKTGFTKDAKLTLDGMTMLLKMRANFTGETGRDISPDRYVDESYYREALATL
ncbi:MAG: transporter periplasmic ligand-binding protein [Xanthobacteraceae bacterium]|nr:transporter periplasmic ligand-binding protein [Xanthobacteraceae bacterium]